MTQVAAREARRREAKGSSRGGVVTFGRNGEVNSSLVPRLGPRGVRSYLGEDLLFGKSFSRCQPAAGRTELTLLSATSLFPLPLPSSTSFFEQRPPRCASSRSSAAVSPASCVSPSLRSRKCSLFASNSADSPCSLRPRSRISQERGRTPRKKADYHRCSVSLSTRFNRLARRSAEANCAHTSCDYSESVREKRRELDLSPSSPRARDISSSIE